MVTRRTRGDCSNTQMEERRKALADNSKGKTEKDNKSQNKKDSHGLEQNFPAGMHNILLAETVKVSDKQLHSVFTFDSRTTLLA